MTYFGILWRVELRAVVALVVCSILVAVVLAVGEVLRPTTLLGPGLTTVWIGFGYTSTLGILPVVFYGAPIYALLRRFDFASWPTILSVGVFPGATLYVCEQFTNVDFMAGWFMTCGVAIATITHFLSISVGRTSRQEDG